MISIASCKPPWRPLGMLRHHILHRGPTPNIAKYKGDKNSYIIYFIYARNASTIIKPHQTLFGRLPSLSRYLQTHRRRRFQSRSRGRFDRSTFIFWWFLAVSNAWFLYHFRSNWFVVPRWYRPNLTNHLIRFFGFLGRRTKTDLQGEEPVALLLQGSWLHAYIHMWERRNSMLLHRGSRRHDRQLSWLWDGWITSLGSGSLSDSDWRQRQLRHWSLQQRRHFAKPLRWSLGNPPLLEIFDRPALLFLEKYDFWLFGSLADEFSAGQPHCWYGFSALISIPAAGSWFHQSRVT